MMSTEAATVSPANAVFDAALQLPATERARLVELLVDSLDDAAQDESVNADWDGVLFKDELVAECQRRLEAYRRGEIEAVDGEEVFRKLLARYPT